MKDHYPFKLMPLRYPYDALEPYIDTETVRIHHNKHLQTYVDNLNKALESYPCYHSWSLEKLIENNHKLPAKIQTAVRNNAGGVYNHNLYFNVMTPNHDEPPSGSLADAIDRYFGSYDAFHAKLKQSALDRFGSGWAWLVSDPCGRLSIVSTPNQQTPLTMNLCPVLLVDVWEHAYYLKYQNKRADYVENWFNLIDWNQAQQNYNFCKK